MCFIVDSGINSPSPGQNGRRFADDVSNAFLWMKSFCISINILPEFVPKDQIVNNPALAQIMAWREERLSEPMLTWFTDAYMRH